jgi:3-hydroxybutyryl-CoA dehydrogenase
MQIVVKAGVSARKAWEAKPLPKGMAIHWLEANEPIPEAAAYFDLCFEETGIAAFEGIQEVPVFVNAVIATCERFSENTIRINGWPGFLENEKTEIAAANKNALHAGMIVLDALQWKYQEVPDTIGMIAPRVIAMIINEAYFALGEEISTKEEIDTAMKLGTNYPFGPFEWSEKIGLIKIYTLLQQLGKQNNRYTIAALLEKEAQATNKPINQ